MTYIDMKKPLGMTPGALTIFILVCLYMIIYAASIPLHPDEAYYWMWSRHLALSYYDGPPLTAWLIRMMTTIFGIHAFVIKSIAVFSVALSSWFIYRLSVAMFDENVALRALLIFMLIPITQATNFITSLDPLLMLFWSAGLCALWKWLTIPSKKRAFCLALVIGLGLLAKYPMILFLPACFLILLFTYYRPRLLHWQPYLIIFIALLIFSPVLIWNASHDWISFTFQWHHGAGAHHFSWHDFEMYWLAQLGAFNPIYAIGLVILSIRYWQDYQQATLQFLAIPMLMVLIIFGYFACFNLTEANWTMPAYITGSILLAYFCDKHYISITFWLGFLLNIAVILILKIPVLTPHALNDLNPIEKFYGYQQVVRPIEQALYHENGVPIVSDTYQDASETAFQLSKHPDVCIVTPTRASQYTIWCQDLKSKVHSNKTHKVVYIGPKSALNLLEKDMQCKTLSATDYHFKNIGRHWVAAECMHK